MTSTEQAPAMERVEAERLEPCPFCGGPATLWEWEFDSHNSQVSCEACCFAIDADSENSGVLNGRSHDELRTISNAEAVAAWNRRSLRKPVEATAGEYGNHDGLGKRIAYAIAEAQGDAYAEYMSEFDGYARAAMSVVVPALTGLQAKLAEVERSYNHECNLHDLTKRAAEQRLATIRKETLEQVIAIVDELAGAFVNGVVPGKQIAAAIRSLAAKEPTP